MKKLSLTLVALLITGISFARTVYFTTSCGIVSNVSNLPANNAEAEVILKDINKALCGTSNVSITWY